MSSAPPKNPIKPTAVPSLMGRDEVLAMPASNAQEIVIFHSALGLRPALLRWAVRLRAAGHVVHTPDLYDGEVFNDRGAAAAKFMQLGFDEILDRSRRAVVDLPNAVVYAGFSNGGACAELLAATRPGAHGAILLHAPLPIRSLGWESWPATCPVQVHFAEKDPLRQQPVIDALAARVRGVGARFEQHDYAGAGHHFSDPDWPGYSAEASEEMFQHVCIFLEGLRPSRAQQAG
jgi:dienelactone hydrolase